MEKVRDDQQCETQVFLILCFCNAGPVILQHGSLSTCASQKQGDLVVVFVYGSCMMQSTSASPTIEVCYPFNINYSRMPPHLRFVVSFDSIL